MYMNARNIALLVGLVGILLAGVALYREGLLGERNRELVRDKRTTELRVKQLIRQANSLECENNQLFGKIEQLERKADSLVSLVEKRDIQIKRLKSQHEKDIVVYLASPDSVRVRLFAKYIERYR